MKKKKMKGTEEKRSAIFKRNIVFTTALNCCHFLKYQEKKIRWNKTREKANNERRAKLMKKLSVSKCVCRL